MTKPTPGDGAGQGGGGAALGASTSGTQGNAGAAAAKDDSGGSSAVNGATGAGDGVAGALSTSTTSREQTKEAEAEEAPAGTPTATPTAQNEELVSQALKDAAAAFLATMPAQRPTHKYQFGKPSTSGRPVSWTPAPLAAVKKHKFVIGSATPVKALSRAELKSLRQVPLPAPEELDDLAVRNQLRTDNMDTSAKPPLVWKTKTVPMTKTRTLPQDLGKKMTKPSPDTALDKSAGRGKRTKGKAGSVSADTTQGGQEQKPPTVQEAENVWKRTKEVLLKDPSTKKPPPEALDEIKYADHYAVARRSDYRTIPNGFQRPRTQLEEETLFLWLAQVIFLAEPPKFITETHTLEERLSFWQLHRRRMFKLYVETPARLRWPAATATFHFCTALVDKNQAGGVDLIDDIHVISCSADSRLAVLHFVRPDTRDKWTNRTFKFPFGQITLRATDTLDQPDQKAGLDATGLALMYPIHLLGRPDMALSDVHAIAKELSGGLPILDVFPLEATGTRALETHEWKILLHGTEAPTGIAQLRCLNITQGDNNFQIGVRQPRLERRHPCSVCLGIGHYRNKCKYKGNAEKTAEVRARFERSFTMPTAKDSAMPPVAETLEEHRVQMAKFRETLAPELAAKEAAERVQREETAKAEREAAAAAAAIQAAAEERERLLKQEEAKAAAQRLRKEKAKAKSSKSPVQLLSAALSRKTTKKSPKSQPPVVKPATPVEKHSPKRTRAPFVAPSSQETRWRGAIEAFAGTEAPSLPQGKRKRETEALSLTMDVFEDTPMDEDVGISEPPASFMKTSEGARLAGVENKKGQAMVTAFFPRQLVDAPADEQASNEVQVTRVVPPVDAPVHAPALLGGLGMSIIGTPMNGSCLLHAMIAALALWCGSRIDANDATEKRATLKLRKDLYERLAEELQNLIDLGSLSLDGLVSLYLDASRATEHQGSHLDQLLEHFRKAGQLNSVSVTREFWGGEAEITAFVEWRREPMYVLDVGPTGETFVTRYELTDVPQEDGTSRARVDQVQTTIPVFRAQIAVYKSQQVIPLVLLCHHTWPDGPTGPAIGHFTAARLPNASYAEWCGSEAKRSAMQSRRNRVEAIILNMRETGATAAPSLTPASTDEASEWKLGDSSAGSSDGSSRAASTGSSSAPPFETDLSEIENASDRSRAVEPDGDERMERGVEGVTTDQPDELVEAELSSILSTQPDPGLSFSAIERLMPISPVVSQDDINSVDAEALLRAMERVKLIDPQSKRALAKTDKATQVAYAAWVRRQAKESPQTHALVKQHKTALKAGAALRDRPDILRALLRALPYPEVVVAQLEDDILVTAGKHIICTALVQLLYRLQSYLDESDRAFCQEWARSIASMLQLVHKWSLAQCDKQWSRLERIAAKVKQPLQGRVPLGLDMKQWARLVAFMIVVPGNVPVYFQSAGFPMQSDALLVWMKRPENLTVVGTAAQALERRRWAEVNAVIQHWQGQGPRLSVTTIVAHSGASDGVAARY